MKNHPHKLGLWLLNKVATREDKVSVVGDGASHFFACPKMWILHNCRRRISSKGCGENRCLKKSTVRRSQHPISRQILWQALQLGLTHARDQDHSGGYDRRIGHTQSTGRLHIRNFRIVGFKIFIPRDAV